MSKEGYGPDLRILIGWMFSILGAILTVYGLFQPAARAPLTRLNINLYWGVLLFVFGVAMLALGYRAERRVKAKAQTQG